MAKDFVLRCDECNKLFNNPSDHKLHVEHILSKSAEVYFSYFSKSANGYKQEKLNIPCQEHHFCNGKCLGRFIDKKVSEATAKIKEE